MATLLQIRTLAQLWRIRRIRRRMRIGRSSEFEPTAEEGRKVMARRNIDRIYVADIGAAAAGGNTVRAYLPPVEDSLVVLGMLIVWTDDSAPAGTEELQLEIKAFDGQVPDTAAAFAANGSPKTPGAVGLPADLNLVYLPVYHRPVNPNSRLGIQLTSAAAVGIAGGSVWLDVEEAR